MLLALLISAGLTQQSATGVAAEMDAMSIRSERRFENSRLDGKVEGGYTRVRRRSRNVGAKR